MATYIVLLSPSAALAKLLSYLLHCGMCNPSMDGTGDLPRNAQGLEAWGSGSNELLQ